MQTNLKISNILILNGMITFYGQGTFLLAATIYKYPPIWFILCFLNFLFRSPNLFICEFIVCFLLINQMASNCIFFWDLACNLQIVDEGSLY